MDNKGKPYIFLCKWFWNVGNVWEKLFLIN